MENIQDGGAVQPPIEAAPQVHHVHENSPSFLSSWRDLLKTSVLCNEASEILKAIEQLTVYLKGSIQAHTLAKLEVSCILKVQWTYRIWIPQIPSSATLTEFPGPRLLQGQKKWVCKAAMSNSTQGNDAKSWP